MAGEMTTNEGVDPRARPLLIWGATGQARVLAEFVGELGFRLVALVDRNCALVSPFPGVALFHDLDTCLAAVGGATNLAGLVAIGGYRGPDRIELQRLLERHGIEPVTVKHRTAFVAENASIGAGSQILANSAVCADAVLGRACIVNTKASVDHECVLGDGVHVAPGATLTGCVEVGEASFIGAGAVVLPRVRIGRAAIVGAGSVVTRDVLDGQVVYGNPARVRRKNSVEHKGNES